MRSVFHQILTVVLVVSLMPGLGELLENVEHLLHDGHLAHATSHEGDEQSVAHEMLVAEHGCTPVSHLCPCHTSMPVILPDTLVLVHIAAASVPLKPIEIEQRIVSRANAPPVPPPIA